MRKKQCTGECGRVLAVTSDNFHRNKQRSDGFDSMCKICRNKYLSKYYIKKPKKVKVILKEKICTGKCERKLPNTLEYFNANPRRYDGTSNRCRKCTQEISLKYYYKNRDKTIELRKREKELRKKRKIKRVKDVVKSAVATAKEKDKNQNFNYNHKPSIDCEYVCPCCGSGVDDNGKEFTSQLQADRHCTLETEE